MIKFNLPLEIQISKNKKFILNLNNYRNTHYQSLNKSKVNYSEEVKSILGDIQETFNQVRLIYTYFPKDKRKRDISNICSIVDKYFCDSLVDLGIIPDDNFDHVKEVTYRFGEIDKNNPRVEVVIEPIN